MISILRPARETGLLTAEVFEALFDRQFGPRFDVRRVPLAAWTTGILGPLSSPCTLDEAAARFAAATAGMDFLCPSYEAIPLAPLYLALRARSGARVRLLLIAHAAGAYMLEWSLIQPLLAPGDLIIAPSASARTTIEFLAPALAPWIRVIPHPMAPLVPRDAQRPSAAASQPRAPRVVSMGRIHVAKLLHRQVEAMAVLRDRGGPLPTLEIAGAVDDAGPMVPHAYARSLSAKIGRLGLVDNVRLVGPVRGTAAQRAFLADAALFLNLSVSIEESFPKAPVEALSMGIGVLGTRWDGLVDSVGACGTLVPLVPSGPGPIAMDASAESIALALEALLGNPPEPDACREHAARFAPSVVMPAYAGALTAARDIAGSSAGGGMLPGWPSRDAGAAALTGDGLLGAIAPLTEFSWREWYAFFAASCVARRASWVGEAGPPGGDDAEQAHAALRAGVQRPLSSFMAYQPGPHWTIAGGHAEDERGARAGETFSRRMAAAASSPGIPSARVACAAVLAPADPACAALLEGTLHALERDGICSDDVDYLRTELEMAVGDPTAALSRARHAVETIPAALATHRVRQVARFARRIGQPALALATIRGWLAAEPDHWQSGAVWLDCALAAADEHHGTGADDATAALDRARSLLGDLPAIRTVKRALALRTAAPGQGDATSGAVTVRQTVQCNP